MRSHLLRLYPDALAILREMGEWMAMGFYEAIDLPWPRPFGMAYRRLYENMEIRPSDTDLLAPAEPFTVLPHRMRRKGEESWRWDCQEHHATGFLIDFMHSPGLHVNPELIPERKEAFPRYATFIDDLVADIGPHLAAFGGYTHSNPDIRRVVHEGFDAMERELDAEISLLASRGDKADAGERALLASLKDYTIGVRAFHARTAALLRAAAAEAEAASGRRAAELAMVAEAFAATFVQPARTFLQGMLAVRFAWLLDGCVSIGRVDQALGALYEADLRSGAISQELASRLVDELFCDMERFNGWNMQIGGYVAWASRPCQTIHENGTPLSPRQNEGETPTPHGTPAPRDGCNDLTREIILACRRNKIRRPNVAFRITSQTPPELVRLAWEVIRDGSGGRPALYNDDLYVRTLQGLAGDLGLSDEDACEIGFGGCTETMIAGMSNVGSLEGDINYAKALELALHDGFDPLAGVQAGPHTGRLADMPDFDAFLAAVKRQIQYATDQYVTHTRVALAERFHRGDPKLYRTFFTRDCVKRHKSFEAGGARYNWALTNAAGTANLIDGVAAVRKCVFDDRSISPSDLLAALRADYVGHEDIHRRLSASPKFGNDDPYVDDVGRDLLTFAWRELYRNETPRGGRFMAACVMFILFGYHGEKVGALPEGRRARTPVGDSIGPRPGCDARGPTAMMKSVTKLPLTLAIGTPVLNLRLQRQFLETPTGIDACVTLLGTYFAMGGLQLQINVVSKDQMLAARKDPDSYRDLIVRTGGYSEYFTKLGKDLQDNIIARTEHGSL